MRNKIQTLIIAIGIAMGAQAQDTDLNVEALKGLELNYLAHAAGSFKADVFNDITYWNLFGVRFKGWNGGNGGYSTPLPDAGTFWSFQDSHFGLISENRNRKTALNNMPRNAAMIQTGEASQDDFITLNDYAGTSLADLSTYYKGTTWMRHADARLSQEDISKGLIDDDVWYWPMDATVVCQSGLPVLQVIMSVQNADGERTAYDLVEFLVEGKPGDANYMKLLRITADIAPQWLLMGTSMIETADRIYVYGCIDDDNPTKGPYAVVARTATRDLRSPWEYYVKDADGNWSWQQGEPQPEQLMASNITSSSTIEHPSVYKYGDKYYLCSLDKQNGAIYMFQADDPWGPFSTRKKVYTLPDEHHNTSRVIVHPQLSRMGELVLSYNMYPAETVIIGRANNGNATETLIAGPQRNFDRWESADLNQMHFLRIFNWQAMYNVDTAGPITDTGTYTYTTAIQRPLLQETDKENPIRLTYNALQQTVTIGYTDTGSAADTQPLHWQIATLTGSLMQQGDGSTRGTVSTATLPHGAYIFSLQRGSHTATLKFVK